MLSCIFLPFALYFNIWVLFVQQSILEITAGNQELHRPTTVCSGPLADSDVTVVSGFWHIRNKYDDDGTVYHSYFNTSLRLNASYVIFYGDEDSFSLLASARAGLPTCFFYYPIEDLIRDFVIAVNFLGPTNGLAGGGYPFALWSIWNSKVRMLSKTMNLNPFSSTWVDAGINIYRRQAPPVESWPHPAQLAQLPKDKLVHASVLAEWAHCFAGTAFMAHHSILPRMASLFHGMISLHCSNDTSTDICLDDQRVFAALIRMHPQLFFSLGNTYPHLTHLWNESPQCTNCGESSWGCVVEKLFLHV